MLARLRRDERRSAADPFGDMSHQLVESSMQLGDFRSGQRRFQLVLHGLAQRNDRIVQALAARRDHEERAAAIPRVLATAGVAVCDQARTGPTDLRLVAVQAKAELPRKCGYRGTSVLRQALDRQQKLMLLGLDALGAGRFLAKVEELPDAAPELSQPAKARF